MPVVAVILVVLGVVLLLQTTGVISWQLWRNLWRFWPVVLIIIGLNIFLQPRTPWLAALLVLLLAVGSVAGAYALTVRGSGSKVTDYTQPLDGMRAANVKIEFGAGRLTVRSLPPDSLNLVEGHLETPGSAARVDFERSGDSGALRFRMPGTRVLGGGSNTQWDVALARSPALALDLNGGAAKIKLDLRDLQVTDVDIDIGAADLEVVMPANAGHVDATVNAGAARVTVIVPQGVASRITRSVGLSSFKVDTSRFPKDDGAYVSPDYSTAKDRVAVEFRGGALSVEVR
ncbi:MAG: hypothetical protein HY683_05680 [Chloroflexi bacterium]|nr:hypothetical protein [Chloroflexota bacterium]